MTMAVESQGTMAVKKHFFPVLLWFLQIEVLLFKTLSLEFSPSPQTRKNLNARVIIRGLT